MSALRRVCVVVPARDEAALISACLDALTVASQALADAFPRIGVDVTVVLDNCRDRTAEIVRARPGVRVVDLDVANVGAARAAGVEAALTAAPAVSAADVWVANTDADTRVPAHWLLGQVALAAEGYDLVTGTVQLPPGTRASTLLGWSRRYRHDERHAHVHGANLGFRASAYLAAGGYRPLPEHEDAEMVTALRRAGTRWIATDAIRVTTSARTRGRTPGGFAGYLRDDASGGHGVRGAVVGGDDGHGAR